MKAQKHFDFLTAVALVSLCVLFASGGALVAAPQILAQPASQAVVLGQDAAFSVEATGTLPLSYQWRRDANELSDETNSILSLASVQAAQAGNYLVVVTDSSGSTDSAVAVLTVNVPPAISAQPADTTVNQGQDINLSVTVSGTAPFNYQWWFNDAPLADATSALLSFSPAQGNQSGSYWIVVSNIAGVVTSRVASLLVIVPPTIIQQPVGQTIFQEESVTFNVVATGTALNYQWKFNGVAISGETNATLELSIVGSSQAGSYTVDVGNAAASVSSTEANLTVYVPPAITIQPADGRLSQGQTTNLSVTTTGTPVPDYQWWFNDAPLASATNATLSFSSAQGNQSGLYWVVVSNIAGVVTSRVATLLVIVPPAIIQQPLAKAIFQGEDAAFSVVATGTAPTYQWMFNNVAIIGATNATLELANVQPARAGSYKVEVENAAGTVTSAEVLLDVYVAPAITTQPVDRTLNQGQNTSLSVSATGTPAPNYQWWFNDAFLASATNATLSFSLIQGSQSGSYWVTVSNIAGVVTSSVATVFVVVPPAIVQQPVGQAIIQGENVAFNVVATGTAPTYQWKFNSIAIPGAKNATLQLSNVQISQAGSYNVEVKNAAASVTSTEVTLTVYVPPTITTQPADRTLNQGQSLSLSVSATGTPAPNYQWSFNDAPLATGTNAMLLFPSAQSNHSGSYSVTVSNIAGMVTSRVATVFVVVPPAIVQQPVEQAIIQGENATFSVVATGTSPTYEWKFNGVAIPGATNTTLQLSNVQSSQTGSYKVEIRNAAASVTSTEVTLTVYVPPAITTQPADRTLNQGQSLSLNVTATGTPAPNYQWSFNDAPLASGTNATLLFPSAQSNHSGSYSVTVSNIAGMVTSRVATVFVVLPPAITQQPVGRAIIQGENAAFSVVATGTAPTYQWMFNNVAIIGATNTTLEMANVQPSQAGSYKVEVQNAAGTVSSAEVLLEVYVIPAITTQPADRTLNQGQSLSLSVSATGTPAPTYQWWFNNALLAGMTNATLLFPSAQSNHSGSYSVTVSNIAGMVTSRVATVFVVLPPTITQQPVGRAIIQGENVAFNVVATGTAPTYQWKFNGIAILGATNATLQFSNVQSSQAGNYKVEIKNAAALVTSTEVTLTVYVPPAITTQPADRTVNQEQSLSLSVTATGIPAPNYQWWFNDALLTGKTNATLSFSSALGNHSGSYAVTVSNIAGMVTSRVATVFVVLPPIIIQQPVGQTIFQGESAAFNVVATGTAPTYQWKFNNAAILGATNATLQLSNVQGSQAGKYKVEVKNAAALVTSAEVTLTVYVPPTITTQPADRTVNQGQSLSLSVATTGVPVPRSQWWFNDSPVAGATNAALSFPSAQGNQSGRYWVVVTNIAGVVTSRVATVLVIVPPAIIQQPVGRTVKRGDNVTFSVVATGTAPTFQWKFNGATISGATNATLQLSDVLPTQSGKYRVEVKNAAGTVTSVGASLVVELLDVFWTDPRNGSWHQADKWSSARVPDIWDNVFIVADGDYTVTVNADAAFNRLTLGGSNGTQTVSISAGLFQSSTDSSASNLVTRHGAIQLDGGVFDVRELNLDGTINWTEGEIRSNTRLSVNSSLNLSGVGLKFLSSGVLDNDATIVWTGNGGFQLGSGASVTNRALFLVQNDVPITSTDHALFVNQGTLRKTTAVNVTELSGIEFRNSGTIDLQTGGLGFSADKHYLSDGTRITGPGSVWVHGAEITCSGTVTTEAPFEISSGELNGVFNLVGKLNFRGGSINDGATITGMLNMLGGVSSGSMTVNGQVNLSAGEIGGGPFTLNGDLNWTNGLISSTEATFDGNINWVGGVLKGNMLVQEQRSLLLLPGGSKQIDGGSLANRSSIVISGTLNCVNGAEIYNDGIFRVENSTPFSGGTGNPSRFYNDGTLLKAVAGALNWGVIELHNRGILEIPDGSLVLVTRAHSLGDNSSVNGPGKFQIQSGSLTLGANVTCVPTLEILDGSIMGSGTFNGSIDWWTGSLSGRLALPANRQLTLSGTGIRSLSTDAILENAGLVLVTGGSLKFFDGAVINNSGTFEVQSDSPFLVNSVSDKPQFNNVGTLRKSVSARSLEFNTIKLQNSGRLEINTGDLLLSGNTHTFNAGSQVLGPVRVAGATLTLNAVVPFSAPLQLASGVLAGNGTVAGGLTWSGGQVTGAPTVTGNSSWSGGTLAGTLSAQATLDWPGGTVAGTLNMTGASQLNVAGNGPRVITGVLNNSGKTTMAAGASVELNSGAQINNIGEFECFSATPFTYRTGARPAFNNTGTFRNLGTGVTTLTTALEFRQSGTVEVATGSVSFASGSHSFNNGARFTGPGSVSIDGATVALNGNVTVTAPFTLVTGLISGTGSFDGNWNWSGGAISGALTQRAGSQLSLSGNLVKVLQKDATLVNAGTVVMNGTGALQFYDGASVNNSGLFDWQSSTAFDIVGSAKPLFINTGILRKSASSVTLAFGGMRLQNSGALEVETGSIAFTANSHSFGNGSRTVGPGKVQVAGGTLTVSGTNTLGGPFEVASGTLTGNATLYGPVTIAGGIVSGTLIVNGDISWTAGELSGSLVEKGTMNWASGKISGTLMVPAGSVVNVLKPGKNTITGVLDNNGLVTVVGDASLELVSGTPVLNSGTLEVQNGAPFIVNGTAKPVINNSGTLRKTISIKPLLFSSIILQNSGTLDIQTGSVEFVLNTHTFTDGARAIGSGPMRVTGATLSIDRNFFVSVPFEVTSGVVSGKATVDGDVTLLGGQLTGTLTVNGDISWSGGRVTGSLVENGAASWSGGQLEGSFAVATNSQLVIFGPLQKLMKGAVLTNSGIITLTGPVALQNDSGSIIQNYGVLSILGQSTVTNLGGARPVLKNYGVLNLTNGFARFNFAGDFYQFSSGLINLEIAGKAAGTNLNQFIGLNNAQLAGALNVTITTNYQPQLGDRLEILKCATRTGTLTPFACNLPGLSSDYTATNVTLFAASPIITKQPQSQTVAGGSTATFSVQTYGTIPMTYQWFSAGLAIARATNSALTLTNVQAADEATYLVGVSNVWGAVTSAPVTLTVIIPPAITRQPVSLTVNQGDSAMLEVEASGTHLDYQWKRGSEAVPGGISPVLVFSDVTAADAGEYKVEISNSGGAVTSTKVLLTVLVPPTIITQPKSKNLNAGSDVTLSIEAIGTAPFGYLWVKDGVAVPGGTNASLVVRKVTAALAGSYIAIVANEAGYAISQPAVIAINAAPQIIAQPLSQSAVVGSNVVLSVTATGVPAPTYQWRKNGVNISGATSATLLLPSVQPSDAGHYNVTVANNLGSVESTTAELTVLVPSLPFADNFADRGIIYTSSAYGRGTNNGATKEVGEPKHARKGSATNSVWISWWAPANGIVTFSTAGSDFDTVLAVYRGSAVNGLTKVAEDDDSAGFHCSTVSFNAQAGTYYQIAVAGFNGASGDIILNWNLVITAELLPPITQAPRDYTGNTNDTVTLQVLFDAIQSTALQWFFQGRLIPNATNSTITITNLQSDKVGGYAVRLTAASGRTVVSTPGDVQINTLGYTQVAARNKLGDSLESALLQAAAISPSKSLSRIVVASASAGPSRGYNGTQIFSTVGADKDQGEPDHCGVPGGASSWFSYQAPVNGILIIDTEGSSFDTVIEVYTGAGTDYQSLQSVACDNDSGADGQDSKVSFQATANTIYYVAVDGVNGASGTVVLNYALGQPPVITADPLSQTAPLGGTITVSATANGTPSPEYQWSFNGAEIPGATNASLTLANFQADRAGSYQVRVSNILGTATSAPAELFVDGPLRLANCSVPASGCFGLKVIGPANTTYVIQSSTDLLNWFPLATNSAPLGLWNFIDTTATNNAGRFYRVLPAP